MTHAEIAQQLKDLSENIILIYAFNATGKTRLSVAYKDLTKEIEDGKTKHAGVYYNAYSEDLFVWDNDIDNGEQNIHLEVIYSSLNNLHNLLTEDAVKEKLTAYKPQYDFRFNTKDAAQGIESISFFIDNPDANPIKISRGEERIFIWCFFLALFEVTGWADDQNEHFFIDDPVSSLDDHNIFITAYTVFDLIEREFENRKIIITSHHFGFLSIISDLLGKGEKADKFRNRGGSKKYKEYILERNKDDLELISPDKGVFLYHLRLLQILEEARNTGVYTYHIAMLRQVLENISSFLGVGMFSFVLQQIGITDADRVAFIVNALSHQNVYQYKTEIPVQDTIDMFEEVMEKLMDKYKFVIHSA